MLRAGVDVGGTFTDLIVVDDATGEFAVGKTLTMPHDPSLAIEVVLNDVMASWGRVVSDVAHMVHGTTLVTNALIERQGDRTALLTTRGFRDAIEIGRESRYDLYDLSIELPKPLIPRSLRFDVPERTLADGTVLQPLDIAFVERLTTELVANGVAAIGVSFLHSYANPLQEKLALQAIRRVSAEMRVSLSCEVSPSIREFERTSTTVANVYVQARVERYLRELQVRLQALGFVGNFYMMLSNGGIATVETAVAFPIRLLESGPAAGALAAASYGAACGEANLVSFDMGGTTAKFCVIEKGAPLLAHEFEFDRIYRFRKGSGLPATISVIEMVEIGAGGGSIARVNSLGLLKVGPDSAGADPGPVCYGRGAMEPTVTDADLVLGYLDPAFFLGGRMALDLAATRAAIRDRVAVPLGISEEEAAWGIHKIVNETMASAARAHVLERGKDPQTQPMFAFGGAGPVHAYRIAQSLGSPRLIVPLGAGIMSTVGFLSAPVSFDFVRPLRCQLESAEWPRGVELLRAMEAEGVALLQQGGLAQSQMTVSYAVDMRYVGQGYEIQVPLMLIAGAVDVEAVHAEFEAEYRRLYGRAGPPVPVEILNWRVTVGGPRPKVRLQVRQAGTQSIEKGVRRAYFPELGGFAPVRVLDRYAMPQQYAFEGPAIVEERESTTVIGPGALCHVDAHWNLVIELPKVSA